MRFRCTFNPPEVPYVRFAALNARPLVPEGSLERHCGGDVAASSLVWVIDVVLCDLEVLVCSPIVVHVFA